MMSYKGKMEYLRRFYLGVGAYWWSIEVGESSQVETVSSSIIHNNQKAEAAQLFMNRWMNIQTTVYTYIHMVEYYLVFRK